VGLGVHRTFLGEGVRDQLCLAPLDQGFGRGDCSGLIASGSSGNECLHLDGKGTRQLRVMVLTASTAWTSAALVATTSVLMRTPLAQRDEGPLRRLGPPRLARSGQSLLHYVP